MLVYMVSKPRVKTQVDKSQDKRIAKLERQFPTVNEVVAVSVAKTFNAATTDDVTALMPVALNDEKIEFRGFSLRGRQSFPTTGNGQDVNARYIVLLYKCTADYSGATAAYTAPTISDILRSSDPNSNYNPDNTNRMRILYDSTRQFNTYNDNYPIEYRKMYKRSISLMPLVDKAFVMRPFLVQTVFGTADQKTLVTSINVDTMTRQAP